MSTSSGTFSGHLETLSAPWSKALILKKCHSTGEVLTSAQDVDDRVYFTEVLGQKFPFISKE